MGRSSRHKSRGPATTGSQALPRGARSASKSGAAAGVSSVGSSAVASSANASSPTATAAGQPLSADNAIGRTRPTGRQKLYLGLSVAAFLIWLGFLLVLALLK